MSVTKNLLAYRDNKLDLFSSLYDNILNKGEKMKAFKIYKNKNINHEISDKGQISYAQMLLMAKHF